MSMSPALALRFMVMMAGLEGMYFTGCDGLGAEYETETYKEGGNAGHTHRLPIRLKYQNVKLTRPVDLDSFRVGMWFQSVQFHKLPLAGMIKIFDGNAMPIATYTLLGVWPISYSGPKLSSDSNTVAHETLELAHTGFVVTPG
jgi:phage tail-like protein